MDSLEQCKANLAAYEKSGLDDEHSKLTDREVSTATKAAVLVPLFLKKGKVHVLLTRRSVLVRSHKGHVSFAGGKQEDFDSNIVETALREANEEIGLAREEVEVVSTLHPHWVGRGKTESKNSSPHLLVYPVVVVLKPDFNVSPDSSEVAEVFDVPLEFFLEQRNHKDKKVVYRGEDYWIHNYSYLSTDGLNTSQNRYFVWGFTGNVCLKVAIVAFRKMPLFELQSKVERALQDFIDLGQVSSKSAQSKL